VEVRARLQWLSLGLVVVGTLAVPLGLRALAPRLRSPDATPSYISAIESPRAREPFNQHLADTLLAERPAYAIVGDSMAKSRIDPDVLTRLAGGRNIAMLVEAARGSAYWYLAFKNWIVGPGVRPDAVIFFFRDENLTDPLFRVWPGALDAAAHDAEPELDRILAARANGAYYRVHLAARGLYEFDAVRAWLEPRLLQAPLALAADGPARAALLGAINDTVFTLETLRPMAAADMEAAGDPALDFYRLLPTSVLPEILRLAKASGIRIAFVRVQRRPEGGQPPRQSRALQRYVSDLAAYLQANGAVFHDDWGDPDQPLAIYEDGDHLDRAYRGRYTELFVRKNPGIFR
jgi:hypothetical protein